MRDTCHANAKVYKEEKKAKNSHENFEEQGW